MQEGCEESNKQHPRQGTLLGQFHHIQGGPGRYVHKSFDVEHPWEWRWWEVFVSEQEVAWSMNFVKKRLVSFVLPFSPSADPARLTPSVELVRVCASEASSSEKDAAQNL